jgi:hypothetical protein
VFTTVLMIEKALSDADIELVTTLHGDEPDSFVVLMEPRGRQDELLRALDDVALGRLDEAVHERRDGGADSAAGSAGVTAEAGLEQTVRRLREGGAAAATGRLVDSHPLDALREAVEESSADEVVVLTAPHFVEEFFHRDWASRARHKVGVPVLKLFAQEA